MTAVLNIEIVSGGFASAVLAINSLASVVPAITFGNVCDVKKVKPEKQKADEDSSGGGSGSVGKSLHLIPAVCSSLFLFILHMPELTATCRLASSYDM